MGKVDVGGGKPLAPSPKQPVAAPAPKHVAPTPSFPKPSQASVYRGSAAHQAAHSRAYGPQGSGVHAAVRAQPVRSSGHSAAVARLASKLAQQSSAQASQRTALRASLLSQQLRQPDVWTPERFGTSSAVYSVKDTIASLLMNKLGLGLPQPTTPYNVGPQGGLYDKGFPGYDRQPRQPPMGAEGQFRRAPIPLTPARPPRALQQMRGLTPLQPSARTSRA